MKMEDAVNVWLYILLTAALVRVSQRHDVGGCSYLWGAWPV